MDLDHLEENRTRVVPPDDLLWMRSEARDASTPEEALQRVRRAAAAVPTVRRVDLGVDMGRPCVVVSTRDTHYHLRLR